MAPYYTGKNYSGPECSWVVKHILNIHEVLGSTPSTSKIY